MKRFLISVDANWKATISSGAWSVGRDLRPCPADKRFPLPPEGELPAATEEHFALCNGDAQELAAAHSAIGSGNSAPLARFGRYLFDTLIGKTHWDTMLVETGAEKEIELALDFPWTDDDMPHPLHQLNWELLRAPAGFLAAAQSAQLSVRPAITRLVPTGAGVLPPRAVHAPPRILFVVGTTLTDPRIRAGAELMALMQYTGRADRTLHTRILLEASGERLKQALQEFQPDVVHFTCHGNIERAGAFLEMRGDKGEAEREKRVFSHNLLEWLAVGGTFPPIVVLSACFSGAMLGPQQTAPLAAQLVRGGVPIVIGMAGKVADRACRLFARGFGASLLDGAPLVAAAAQGRRAAAYDAARPPERAPDWMMPTVFLSDKVPEGYAPFAGQQVAEQAAALRARIKSYGLEREPVFYGRADFFDEYYKLLGTEGRPVLMAFTSSTEAGLGRKRLLNELAIQALLDGHIPVLINPAQSAWTAPTDPAKFAAQLDRAISDARAALGIREHEGLLLRLAAQSVAESKADPQLSLAVRSELQRENAVTAHAVRLATQADVSALAGDARGAGKATGRVIVLLNQLHRYGDALLNALLNQWLGDFGFGTAEEPAPAILAFAQGDVADVVLKPFAEGRSAKPWVRALPLAPFRDDGEDLQAYARALMYPSSLEWPIGQKMPLAINAEAGEALRQQWETNFRQALGGKPHTLMETPFVLMAEMARQATYLIAASDERVLQDMARDL